MIDKYEGPIIAILVIKKQKNTAETVIVIVLLYFHLKALHCFFTPVRSELNEHVTDQ